MKNILIIIGTRPEAIKMCPLIIELKNRKNFNVKVCLTGQHKEMLFQVINYFKIHVDYDLAIMENNQTLFDISSKILVRLKDILIENRPDICLVHGDTNTTFIGALACYYLNIPIGHVEAGLRTYNKYSPFPEEFNRRAVSIISDYNFAPTKFAYNNLINEGNDSNTIFITGNTVIDAMKYTVSNQYTHPELEWAKDSKFILVTAHRRENLGEPMRRMFRAIKRVLNEHKNVKAIYPIHMNPIVRNIATEILYDCDNIHIIDPIDVFDCHNFEARCFLCLTDSGGIQEECPTYGKPVLVMRDTTERPEGIEAGTSLLVGTNEEKIYDCFSQLIEDKNKYNLMAHAKNPYGDGHACERIADIIEFGKAKNEFI